MIFNTWVEVGGELVAEEHNAPTARGNEWFVRRLFDPTSALGARHLGQATARLVGGSVPTLGAGVASTVRRGAVGVLPPAGNDPVSASLFLGEYDEDEFYPDLEGQRFIIMVDPVARTANVVVTASAIRTVGDPNPLLYVRWPRTANPTRLDISPGDTVSYTFDGRPRPPRRVSTVTHYFEGAYIDLVGGVPAAHPGSSPGFDVEYDGSQFRVEEYVPRAGAPRLRYGAGDVPTTTATLAAPLPAIPSTFVSMPGRFDYKADWPNGQLVAFGPSYAIANARSEIDPNWQPPVEGGDPVRCYTFRSPPAAADGTVSGIDFLLGTDVIASTTFSPPLPVRGGQPVTVRWCPEAASAIPAPSTTIRTTDGSLAYANLTTAMLEAMLNGMSPPTLGAGIVAAPANYRHLIVRPYAANGNRLAAQTFQSNPVIEPYDGTNWTSTWRYTRPPVTGAAGIAFAISDGATEVVAATVPVSMVPVAGSRVVMSNTSLAALTA